VQAKLARILRSHDIVGWSRNEESGRLDRRALTRFATGSANVFSRREVKPAVKSAVHVLLDLSFSMKESNRIEISRAVTIQLAKLLDRAKVAFMINGFNLPHCFYLGDGTFAQELRITSFKRWNESMAQCSAALGAIDENMAGDSTPDYLGVQWGIDQLANRSEQRRLLFVITDADGYDIPQMKSLEAYAKKLNVQIVAIGLGDTEVERCFKHSTNVHDVQSLGQQSFRVLLDSVR